MSTAQIPVVLLLVLDDVHLVTEGAVLRDDRPSRGAAATGLSRAAAAIAELL